MRKTLLPALACSLAALGWTAAAVATPPAQPVEHPAPKPDGDHQGGDHHEGDSKPASH